MKEAPEAGPPKRQYKVRFLSNKPCHSDSDVQEFLRVFNQDNFEGEISEQKITNRQQGKGQKNQTVRTVDPAADPYAARRWLNSLIQQPNSVMLLKIDRIKGEPLVVPAVMKELFRNNRSAVICGASAAIQRQLQAGVDLEFKQIPPMIAADKELLDSLLERIKRKTGFQSSLRSIGELSFLSDEMKEKIKTIQSGKPFPPLSDPEVVNLCLLSDLCSRYEGVLQSFTRSFQEGEQPVSTLSGIFDTLTSDVTPPQLIREFLPFAHSEDHSNIKNKALLCGYIYKNLMECDKSSKKEVRQTRFTFNQKLRDIVIRQRIPSDTSAFRQCFFLTEQRDVEKIVGQTVMPIFNKLEQFVESGEPELGAEDRIELFKFIIQIAKKGRERESDEEQAKPKPKPQVARSAFAQAMHKSKEEPAVEQSSEMERMVARKIFSQIYLQNFDLFALWDPQSESYPLVDKPKDLIRQLLMTELSRQELVDIVRRLREMLHPYEKIVATLQKKIIESIEGREGLKTKELEHVYIVNSLPEVVNYRFDVGTTSIHSIERSCTRTVLSDRLGLNISLKPRKESDVTLFVQPNLPKLGVFQNDAELVAKAYVALLGDRVSNRVKQFTDHKINHLMRTYRKNFFEMLYEFVSVQSNTPISRIQLVKFLKSHNLLANLMDKGWEEGDTNENFDPMLPMDIIEGKETIKLPEEFQSFQQIYQEHFQTFAKLMQDVKASATKYPEQDNPNLVLWILFQKGIYNFASSPAQKILKETVFYKYLHDFLVFVSSKHFKEFTQELNTKGVNLYVPRKYRELLYLGSHFGFLVKEKIVRYNLKPTPASIEDLDKLSKIFIKELDEEIQKDNPRKGAESLSKLVLTFRRANHIWSDFSRSLTIACVDRILTETSVKDVVPGKVLPQHLKASVPDKRKLCLGKSIVSGQATDFSKVLQGSEEMGDVLKNDDINCTTLDEFAIAVHKIERLSSDLEHYAGLANDVLGITRMLTCNKVEAPFVSKLETCGELLNKLLSKSLRDISENDIEQAHKIASQMRAVRLKLQDIRLGEKEKRFISKLRDELEALRSDGHQSKMNFSDVFILEKTDIKVVEKDKDGKQVQKKKEVEVSAAHQTFVDRIREVIKIHKILNKKYYFIFSPEGQKKKQISYLLNIVRVLISLKGKSVRFYLDTTTLDSTQQKEIATLIQPSNFYRQADLFVETKAVS
ncbi:MAG: hypothetical protein HQM14_11270 [SAR324 cluster bacterium]|nr:hypothetical protein [SAR324 cluster bacterium]